MRLMVILAAALVAVAAAAQPVQEKKFDIRIEKGPLGPGVPGGGEPVSDTVHFIASEFSWDVKPVKGAPYSAEAVTETLQVLADGNRISRKTTQQLHRDGEGRTRTEQTLDGIGPWTAAKEHKTIFINDPVAGVNWVLDPETKTARKIKVTSTHVPGGGGPVPHAVGGGVMIREGVGGVPGGVPGGVSGGVLTFKSEEGKPAHFIHSENVKTEKLGQKNIEGLVCEGTRTTTTIPAGQVGNERPLVSVSERWYSSELQQVVFSKRSDPRFGETSYRLANVRRGEPGRTLFEVSPDYTVTEKGDVLVKMQEKVR